MSYPILYKSTEQAFDSNGLGILSDAITCTVTEERNGAFELEMKYPTSGIHFAELSLRSLIFAKPSPQRDPQPFRVYRITKPLAGIVTVYAQHISYDISGAPADPFTAKNAAEAMAKLESSAAVSGPFRFWTDKSTSAAMKVTVPTSTRALLGGMQGSVLDAYGGEYEFDRYTVRLYEQRGLDRGVTIRYGKNLTDLAQEENCANVYTGVRPYWSGAEGDLVQLPEKTLDPPGSYDFVRILTLDLSENWQEKPTVEQLRSAAEAYMKSNNIGVPKVSLTVSFVQLAQTEEYKHLAMMERVELCDTVHVEFPAMGVSASAKCVKTVYNVLLDRYESISLGEARASIANTIASQQQSLRQTPTKTAMQQAIDRGTALITGNQGGFAVWHDSDGDGKPDEALWMDTDDISTATQILRINKSGIGFSSNGYKGPYRSAWTLDGSFVADFITTGNLNASLITVGTMMADRIHGGTLTLGGSGNGNGSLSIRNAGGKEIGYIDNTGIHFKQGSISLGNGKFVVNEDGNLTAENGEFRGYVQAKNILAGGDNGYIDGDQIGAETIGSNNLGSSSVTNGKIGTSAVTGPKISGGGISLPKLDSELQDAVADAIYAGRVFSGFVTAGQISAAEVMATNYFWYQGRRVQPIYDDASGVTYLGYA